MHTQFRKRKNQPLQEAAHTVPKTDITISKRAGKLPYFSCPLFFPRLTNRIRNPVGPCSRAFPNPEGRCSCTSPEKAARLSFARYMYAAQLPRPF